MRQGQYLVVHHRLEELIPQLEDGETLPLLLDRLGTADAVADLCRRRVSARTSTIPNLGSRLLIIFCQIRHIFAF